MKIHVPPIKCQGIKTRLVPWIEEHVELSSNELWIEPFTGSGVVGFNVRPKHALFADINPHIINFYNAIKGRYITASKARAFLEKEGDSLCKKGEQYYYEVRERFNADKDPFDFLFLSRSCFNGVIRFNKKGQYNVPFCHKPERFTRSYITKVVNQIKYVETAVTQYDWHFVCSDFRSIIKNSGTKNFLYCDPPYVGRHTDYFNTWTTEEENELFVLLSETSMKFILSTWHSNKYRHNDVLERYSNHFWILTKEHFYHVGASEANRSPMLEAIVLNYPSVHLQKPYERKSSEEMQQLRLLENQSIYG